MYDALSRDYDRFVNWPDRLAFELPFIYQQIQATMQGALQGRLLDAACGTGRHAIELARQGYAVAGADLSPGMVQQAQANAAAAGVAVDFRVAGFGALRQSFSGYDVLLCLGNSLPHVAGPAELAAALADFAACLRPGGCLILQNRNFDAVLARRERWMPPQSHREGPAEWLFLRFYDFEPDGLLNFHMVTLQRPAPEAPWQPRVDSARLYPLPAAVLGPALQAAGFAQVELFGDLAGAAFIPTASSNLVVVARRAA
jgi:SAM-dependent methyltransferase